VKFCFLCTDKDTRPWCCLKNSTLFSFFCSSRTLHFEKQNMRRCFITSCRAKQNTAGFPEVEIRMFFRGGGSLVQISELLSVFNANTQVFSENY